MRICTQRPALLLTLSLLLGALPIVAEEPPELSPEKRLEALEQEERQLRERLEQIEVERAEARDALFRARLDGRTEGWGTATVQHEAPFTDLDGGQTPLPVGTTLTILGFDQEMRFLPFKDACCLVRLENGGNGFFSVYELDATTQQLIQDLEKKRSKEEQEAKEQRRLEEERRAEEERAAERRAAAQRQAAAKETRERELTEKWGREIAAKLMRRMYWIGMSKEMAVDSLGQPDDINRTVTTTAVQEQWVYGRRLFLYFDETGTLRSFQD